MKKLGIFLIVLVSLVFSVNGCKRNLPTEPDIPELEKPFIKHFTATPSEIEPGESSVLSWEVVNATSVTIEGIGTVSLSGSKTIFPETTTTYTLKASNSAGTVTQSLVVTVTVNPEFPVIEVFIATPSEIKQGESSVLSWQTSKADKAVIDQGIGEVPLTGTNSVSPRETTTYTLTASNSSGTATKSVTVTVKKYPSIEFFIATPSEIYYPNSSVLSWQCDWVAIDAEIDQGIGNVPTRGSIEVWPEETTTYTLTVTSLDGLKTSASVQVIVKWPQYLVAVDKIEWTDPVSDTSMFVQCLVTLKNVGQAKVYHITAIIYLYDSTGKNIEISGVYFRGLGGEYILELDIGETATGYSNIYYANRKIMDDSKTKVEITWSEQPDTQR